MYPTLQDKEFMILNKISLKQGINRFDIVVVQENNKYIIKRVIGLPGESVMYKDNKLYINGKAVEDNYSKTTTNDFDNVVLGENEYFIADLIGLKVVSDEGEELGTLSDVLQTGANDVYVVSKENTPDLLIPAIRDCIRQVDIESGTMQVHLLAGLR